MEGARGAEDHSEVRQVAVDETASRRVHNYNSLFFDVDRKRWLLFGVEGRNLGAVAAFSKTYGSTAGIEWVCCDMASAYIRAGG